jgi:uncharacterized membrane protein YphA (DoxX/SURF4 family)
MSSIRVRLDARLERQSLGQSQTRGLLIPIPRKCHKKITKHRDSFLIVREYPGIEARAETASRRRSILQRLFSAFPRGRAGVGLLLLRAAVGVVGLFHGTLFLTNQTDTILENWVVGLALAGSGVLLLVGLMTPLASTVVALATLALGVSWLHPAGADLLHGPLSAALLVIVATAVALLGPGSFSLDCRLFGRREIIIPRVSQPPGT